MVSVPTACFNKGEPGRNQIFFLVPEKFLKLIINKI